jgi:hypothetical protein
LPFTVSSPIVFYPPPPPPGKSSLKLVCNVNIVYGNLKSENSQDYAPKPQRNCTFMHELGFWSCADQIYEYTHICTYLSTCYCGSKVQRIGIKRICYYKRYGAIQISFELAYKEYRITEAMSRYIHGEIKKHMMLQIKL